MLKISMCILFCSVSVNIRTDIWSMLCFVCDNIFAKNAGLWTIQNNIHQISLFFFLRLTILVVTRFLQSVGNYHNISFHKSRNNREGFTVKINFQSDFHQEIVLTCDSSKFLCAIVMTLH